MKNIYQSGLETALESVGLLAIINTTILLCCERRRGIEETTLEMGCCLSRWHQRQAKDSSFRENPKVRNSHEPHLPGRDPPPEPEVETVKEVLSETPKPRVKGQQGTKPFPEDATHGPTNARDERSEDDSVSENFSVQTTTTKKRGDEVDAGEQRPRSRSPAKVQKKRSFSGELSCKRERCVAGGMLRRADGRTMSARETGPRSRDLGERSGRRSVSPAAKQRASGPQCRSLSAPRTSPRRVPPRRAQEVHGRGGLEAKESLENPLVSLECFIFL